MPDKIKEVYELISDKGYFTDENEFRKFVQDPKMRKEAYELISGDGIFTDENEFNSYFEEPVKKKEPTPSDSNSFIGPVQPNSPLAKPKVNPWDPQPTTKDKLLAERGLATTTETSATETPSGTAKPPQNIPIADNQAKVKQDIKKVEDTNNRVALYDVKEIASGQGKTTTEYFDANTDVFKPYLGSEEQIQEYEIAKSVSQLENEVKQLEDRAKTAGPLAQNQMNPELAINTKRFELMKAKQQQAKFVANRTNRINTEIEAKKQELKEREELASRTLDEDHKSDAENLRKEIKALEGQRDGYFKDPNAQILKIYSDNKGDMDDFQVPGKTPLERTKNYALILKQRMDELAEKLELGKGTADAGAIEGIMQKVDQNYQYNLGRYLDLEAKLKQIAPIALLNQTPKLGTDGFFNKAVNALGRELMPENVLKKTENMTNSDIGEIIQANQVAMSLSPELITEGALSTTEEATRPTEAFSPAWWGDLTGTSLSMIPAFILGNKVTAAAKIPMAFEKIALAMNAKKYGRYFSPILKSVEKGTEYMAAKPFLSENLADEASFMSGFLGQAISGPMGKAISSIPMTTMFTKLFGDKAPMVYRLVKKLGDKVSGGLGEYGEEVGNTLGPIVETYIAGQDFGQLKKDLEENFGTMDQNVELFVGSFVMGMAMGSGTGLGDASLNKSREHYASLNPKQKEQADKIVKAFTDDVKKSEVEAKKEEIKEGVAPIAEEVSDIDLQELEAAKETIKNPNTTNAEKVEAGKKIKEIQEKKRNQEITETAIEEGIKEGEVKAEEVPSDVVEETPIEVVEEVKEAPIVDDNISVESENDISEEIINDEEEVKEVVGKSKEFWTDQKSIGNNNEAQIGDKVFFDKEEYVVKKRVQMGKSKDSTKYLLEPTDKQNPKAEPIEVKQEESTPKVEKETYTSETSDVKVKGTIDGKIAKLSTIEVKPRSQKQGIGKSEVEKFIKWAKENGAEEIKIDAFKKSIGFWEKMGFEMEKDFPIINGVKQDYKDGVIKLNTNDKLITSINNKDWWRTAVNEDAVNERGLFLASSFEEAEFYGRPMDKPTKVSVKNPLIGSESFIMQELGIELPSDEISVQERFELDKKIKESAMAKGYDAVALMTDKAYDKYKNNGTIPKSIELNVFSKAESKVETPKEEEVVKEQKSEINEQTQPLKVKKVDKVKTLSKDNKVISAEVVSQKGDKVTLKLSDGSTTVKSKTELFKTKKDAEVVAKANKEQDAIQNKEQQEKQSEKETIIKDRILGRLSAYNKLSSFQQNTQKNRDEIRDIFDSATRNGFTIQDANAKNSNPTKKYELLKDGKKVGRSQSKNETPKATPEQVKVAEKLLNDDMITLWDGNPLTPHLDAVSYGITWQQIRKGEQDIKEGKVDTAPARKLIEVLNQIESDQDVSMIVGAGAMMQNVGFDLAEARQAKKEIPELTDADLNEINANVDSLAKEYDEWFETLTEQEQINILEEYESRNQNEIEQSPESRESKNNVSNEKDGTSEAVEEKVKSPREKSQEKAIDKLIDTLESLKVDNKNKLNAFGLLPETWNTALDIVITTIKAGERTAKAVGVAIQKAINYVNSTNEKDNFDQNGFEDFVYGKLKVERPQAIEPPKTPKEVEVYQEVKVEEITSEVDTKKEPSKRKKALLNKAFNGVTDQQVKEAISKHDLEYYQESWITAKASAQAYIDEVGLDNALDSVRKGMVVGAPAAYIWSENIDEVGRQLALATDPTEVKQLQEIQASLLEEFGVQTKKGGQFISALRDIYANSEFGYDTTNQIKKYKDANNGVIPKEVEDRMIQMGKELEEIKTKLAKAEQDLKTEQEKQAIAAIEESVEREAKRNQDKTIKQKTKEIADKIRKGKTSRPSIFMSSSPAAIVWDGALEVAAQAIEATGVVANAINKAVKHLKDSEWYQGLSKDIQKEAENELRNHINQSTDVEVGVTITNNKLKIPHELIRQYVANGVTEIEELVQAIKNELSETNPEITDRQIRDAITNYGKIINVNKEEIETQIRKMKRIGRIVSALEDIANKKRPLRSGQQRDKLDVEERALNKQLKEALKELPMDAEAEANQLKTSLDAVKSRLRNQIEDLERQIETREKSAKARAIPYDEEAKQLIDERDRLKALRDEIFGGAEVSEEQRIERTIKATERAIKDLEQRIADNDLETKKSKAITSPELEMVRARLSVLRTQMKQMQEDAGMPQKRKLENAKRRTEKQIEILKQRIANKDFAKKKPKPLISDTELDKLRAEKIRIQNEFDKLQYQNELKNRTKGQKVADGMFEIWNLTRALRATGELSPVLLQGGVYTIGQSITNPMLAIRSFAEMFTQGFSEKKHEQWLQKLQAQEYYPRLKQSKLAITETDVKLNAKEELFLSGWVNHIWDGLGLPLKMIGPNAYEIWKRLSPPKFFERATVAYLNNLRLEKYLQGEEMLRLQGIEYNGNEKQYRAVADVINTFTGRGSLGRLEMVSKPLAAVFFSPRMWSSTIQQTVALPYFYASARNKESTDGIKRVLKPTVAQKMILTDYMKYVALTASMLMLVKAAEDDDDKDGMKVEMDSRSSDFGKIKFGNTRIDPWGGRIQNIVFLSRMMSDSIVTGGEVRQLGSTPFTPTKGGLLMRMIQNKLAPSSAMLAKYMFSTWKTNEITGEKYRVDQFGEPIGGPLSMATDNLYPIYYETIAEINKEQSGVVEGFLVAAAFFGMGVSVYGNDKILTNDEIYEYINKLNESRDEKGREKLRALINKQNKLKGITPKNKQIEFEKPKQPYRPITPGEYQIMLQQAMLKPATTND